MVATNIPCLTAHIEVDLWLWDKNPPPNPLRGGELEEYSEDEGEVGVISTIKMQQIR